MRAVASFWKTPWALAREDPHRILHSIKFGLALCFVCQMYFIDFFYHMFGMNVTWAIITVVFVFEYRVGAVLSKGINRAIGTFSAGALAVLLGYFAHKMGYPAKLIFLSLCIFVIGSIATFIRFFPNIKKKYDYSALIFILTFGIMTVPAYRANNVVHEVYERFTTVVIGFVAALTFGVLIFPIWAGEDLHCSLTKNLQIIIECLEAGVEEYFDGTKEYVNPQCRSIKNCKAVLDSKAIQDSLGNFACWEPRHGVFHFRSPWKHYLKVGQVIRSCAYTVDTLQGYLLYEIQASLARRSELRTGCSKVSAEAVEVLKEVMGNLKNLEQCRDVDSIVLKLRMAVADLEGEILRKPELFVCCTQIDRPMMMNAGGHHEGASSVTQQSYDVIEPLALASFVCTLKEIAKRVEHVATNIEELGKLAGFKAIR